MYSLVETFDSIQGEGLYAGSLCFFLRLGGCDIGCHWCDEKKSWNESKHPKTSLNNIVKLVSQSPSEIVIITGGEPLMHDLDELTPKCYFNLLDHRTLNILKVDNLANILCNTAFAIRH